MLRLRVAAFCSPLSRASSEDEQIAAQAANVMQNVQIVWYRKVKPKAKTFTTVDNVPLQKPFQISNDNGSDEETYVSFDAELSLCDTDGGPAIEIRTVPNKKCAHNLKNFDLIDINTHMDTIATFTDAHSPRSVESVSVLTGVGAEDSCPVLERLVPLNLIDSAALGGKWDFQNMLTTIGSGSNLDCGIKVYSCKFNVALNKFYSRHYCLDCRPFSHCSSFLILSMR